MPERRRLTIEELELMPVELWRLEVLQIGVEAAASGWPLIEAEAGELAMSEDLSPAKVMEIRGRLMAAIGEVERPEFVKPGATA